MVPKPKHNFLRDVVAVVGLVGFNYIVEAIALNTGLNGRNVVVDVHPVDASQNRS